MPFCGEKPYIKVNTVGHTTTAYSFSAILGCEKCGFHMRADNIFQVDAFMNVKVVSDGVGHMIEQWNRRCDNAGRI